MGTEGGQVARVLGGRGLLHAKFDIKTIYGLNRPLKAEEAPCTPVGFLL